MQEQRRQRGEAFFRVQREASPIGQLLYARPSDLTIEPFSTPCFRFRAENAMQTVPCLWMELQIQQRSIVFRRKTKDGNQAGIKEQPLHSSHASVRKKQHHSFLQSPAASGTKQSQNTQPCSQSRYLQTVISDINQARTKASIQGSSKVRMKEGIAAQIQALEAGMGYLARTGAWEERGQVADSERETGSVSSNSEGEDPDNSSMVETASTRNTAPSSNDRLLVSSSNLQVGLRSTDQAIGSRCTYDFLKIRPDCL